MKALVLVAIAASACFGSDVSGVWRLKHASGAGHSIPIVVQLEQFGDHVQVLRIVSSIRGERVEQFWLTAAAIHNLARAMEITVAGETWTIAASGELIIHKGNGQRVVLEPAEGVVE